MTARRAEAALHPVPHTAGGLRALLPADKQAEFDDQVAAFESAPGAKLWVMAAFEVDPSLAAKLHRVELSNEGAFWAWVAVLNAASAEPFLQVVRTASDEPDDVVYPAKTLDGITQVLVANANPDVVTDFEDALGRAWAAAKEGDTLQPLDALVDAWWPQAVFWADRDKALRTLADNEDILANGLGDRKRHKAADVFAEWEARHGQKLDAKR